MNIYYIDYENVNSSGLKGIQLLDTDSQVNILYSKKADNVKIDALTELMKSKAEIHFLPVHVGTPNALDFQLVTLLFLHYQTDNHYYIISKDSGYDCCIRTAQENGAPHVQRFRDIESSFQGIGREQSSPAGQAAVSGSDAPAAAPQVSVPSDTASAATTAADSPAAPSDSPAHHSRRRRRSSRKPVSSRTVPQPEENNPQIPVLSVPSETGSGETAEVSLAESVSDIPDQEQTSGSLTEIVRSVPSPVKRISEAWKKADPAASSDKKDYDNVHAGTAAETDAGEKTESLPPEGHTAVGSLPQEAEFSVRKAAAANPAAAAGKETTVMSHTDAAGKKTAVTDQTDPSGEKAAVTSHDSDASGRKTAVTSTDDSGAEDTAARPASSGREETPSHPASGASDSHHRYPYGRISEVITRRCGFTPDEKQLSVIRDVLLKAKNKQQFYSSIVRRCGQKEGLALYHTIRCAYNDLLAIENK